jgi:hypothetical protein
MLKIQFSTQPEKKSYLDGQLNTILERPENFTENVTKI